MRKVVIPVQLKEEFVTVETLWHSIRKTRHVDTLTLWWASVMNGTYWIPEGACILVQNLELSCRRFSTYPAYLPRSHTGRIL